jgi:hypothetical protein
MKACIKRKDKKNVKKISQASEKGENQADKPIK